MGRNNTVGRSLALCRQSFILCLSNEQNFESEFLFASTGINKLAIAKQNNAGEQ